jgi:hypothetical protein
MKGDTKNGPVMMETCGQPIKAASSGSRSIRFARGSSEGAELSSMRDHQLSAQRFRGEISPKDAKQIYAG